MYYKTNNTPPRIRTDPIQKDKPTCSPRNIHPSNVPTNGWKKKYSPPRDASTICNPLFHKKNAPAVETTPRYKIPPPIAG